MSNDKIVFLSLLIVCTLYTSNAAVIYCYYPSPVPFNTNGQNGQFIPNCKGTINVPTQAVKFFHYDCGNANLNVALYVNGSYKGYRTIAPGVTGSILSNVAGNFEIMISLQSGNANSCRLEVTYL